MTAKPAGSFTMGSPETEPDRLAQEGPQHKVTFVAPFAVGRFAVTFAEWDGKGRLTVDQRGWIGPFEAALREPGEGGEKTPQPAPRRKFWRRR